MCVYIYIYIYIYMCIYLYIHIYIYREREGDMYKSGNDINNYLVMDDILLLLGCDLTT